MKKIVAIIAILYAVAVIAISFQFSNIRRFDVVANQAIAAFENIMENTPATDILRTHSVFENVTYDDFYHFVWERRDMLHYNKDLYIFELCVGGDNIFRWAHHWQDNEETIGFLTVDDELTAFDLR